MFLRKEGPRKGPLVNVRKLLGAYGLWLAGVLSAALAAAWWLHLARRGTYDAEQGAEPEGY